MCVRRLLGAAGLVCLGMWPALAQQNHVPGRVLVRFHDSVPADQAKTIIESAQGRTVSEIPGIGVHIVQLPPTASEIAVQNAFRQRPEVEFAELDGIREHQQTSQLTPNDPQYTNEWHLKKISAPQAWSVTTGTPGVIIAIADTGVDGTHPDLMPKMVAGWNVNDNNSDTHDVYGHGTEVAGTVAAASNNGLGVASIAWNCWIMPVRVSLTNGSAYDSTIASGITWAADHGARVVNASYQVTSSSTVTSAAKYMNSKGGVVTISAGNYATYDTNAKNPYVLTVGATDPNDLLYSWSNTGTDIALVAPGCVVTTTNGGGYANACGTSFSAPVVAGVAALVMSANPGLSANQVMSVIQSSADDLGTPGWDPTFGSGRVNAARAVAGTSTIAADTQPPTVSFSSPAAGAVVSGTVNVQVNASDNVGVTSLTVVGNGSTIGTSSSFSWNTAAWANGTYTLTATAKDSAGNAASSSVSVTISNTSLDKTVPVVSITSPTAGSTVTGIVALAAKASDNVQVVKVQYYCDGALIGTATSAPYSVKWNARKISKGAHILQAKAYDAAGNVGSSATVSVTVQ